MIEITGFIKHNGPLTKRISLGADGQPISDGSHCIMAQGEARRVTLPDLGSFARLIGQMEPHKAIGLGALRADLPDRVEIVTKARLNGTTPPDLIARTADFIVYRPGQPALVLIDIDTKGMPAAVKSRVAEIGGFWPALVSILPELAMAGHIERKSTSAGLSRSDTGEQLPGSDGVHIYVLIRDGADAERFLRTLHDRCWLQGFGWQMVGAGGQLLNRSIVDRMVYAPERLVFEGAPVLDDPLVQDADCRQPAAMDGDALDTIAACPPLRIVERARLEELLAIDAHHLAPDRAEARETFLNVQAKRIVERTGVAKDAARRTAERQCSGVLLPAVELPFDDREFAGCTVADVLADPDRFVGATLADPLEGTPYGRCKAKIMRRADGSVWIHSFAHGRTIYELNLDAAAVEAALNKAPANEVAAMFVRLVLAADLGADELEHLLDLTSQRAGVGKRAIERKLNAARHERASRWAEEQRNQQAALRRDPRPLIRAPYNDAPWLPQMQILNDVLGASTAAEPPMRDVEGYLTSIHVRRVPSMHTLTARGTNEGETDETRLPAPEEPLLTRLDEAQVAELIERHIDYTDANGRSVHLAAPFVKHYRQRDDCALPIVTAVATLPIVLADGTILSGRGLDRTHGIVFRVPDELHELLREQADCTPSTVAAAMRFLTDDFLVDVATDYAGKCVLIALALTVIERAALPERPAFFASAGQPSSGKTTVVNMISMAVLGRRASASAWSPSDEERRKALFANLGEGVALLVWDNIPRGAAISCPSIEKALTAETYKDRILGVTENRTVPASTIQAFTGNNIGPRGDMASRSLTARLNVDRPDPANRPFTHPDPIAWTEANRGRILCALYTVLLCNPRLRANDLEPAETRFKMWWRLVGSAIEHAAEQHAQHVASLVVDSHPTCKPAKVSFRKLFVAAEAEEEQSSALATVLDVLHSKWPSGFKASDVAYYAGAADVGSIEFKAALELASGKLLPIITATTVTWRLKALADAPVHVGREVLTLRYTPGHHGGTFVVQRR